MMTAPNDEILQLQSNWGALLSILQAQLEDPEIEPGDLSELMETFESTTKQVASALGKDGEIFQALGDIIIGTNFVIDKDIKNAMDRIKKGIDRFASIKDDDHGAPFEEVLSTAVDVLMMENFPKEARQVLDHVERTIGYKTEGSIRQLVVAAYIADTERDEDKRDGYIQKALEIAEKDNTGDTLKKVAEAIALDAEDDEEIARALNYLQGRIIPTLTKMYSTSVKDSDIASVGLLEFEEERARIRCWDFQNGNADPYPLAYTKTMVANLLMQQQNLEEALEMYKELGSILNRLEILGEAFPIDTEPDEDFGWDADIWDATSEGGDYDPYDDEDPDEAFDPESIKEDDEFTEVIGVFTDERNGRVYTESLNNSQESDQDEQDEVARAILRFDGPEDLDQLFALITGGMGVTAHMLGGTRGDKALLEQALECYEQMIELIEEEDFPLDSEDFTAKADMVRKQIEMLG
ncbi:MAG: hypothetical protein JJU11_11290 [Candidatus Sumerlaeia bacterium]|nr:hypothetical protein [Candidatus Sumerlaeia bacterium]